jgi:hypothetical protein
MRTNRVLGGHGSQGARCDQIRCWAATVSNVLGAITPTCSAGTASTCFVRSDRGLGGHGSQRASGITQRAARPRSQSARLRSDTVLAASRFFVRISFVVEFDAARARLLQPRIQRVRQIPAVAAVGQMVSGLDQRRLRDFEEPREVPRPEAARPLSQPQARPMPAQPHAGALPPSTLVDPPSTLRDRTKHLV